MACAQPVRTVITLEHHLPNPSMSRLFSEGLGPAVWRAGLADPTRHWKRGNSAWELAVSWEAQRSTESGLPPEVARALTSHPAFANPTLLLGAIEHSVVLDGSSRPSQNDLWAILLTDSGQVSMAVEGKAGEEFDRTLAEWLDSKSKATRLQFLCDTLGICDPPGGHLRYQLFHRTASAVIEARRWRIPNALVLVQSFAESKSAWNDFTSFAALLGIATTRNAVCGGRDLQGVRLYVAWVDSPKADDKLAAAAV